MQKQWKFAAMALMGLVLAISGVQAWAHAVLVASTPKAGVVVNAGDLPVDLKFNSRVDAKRSTLTLVGPGGEKQTVTISEQSSPDALHGEAHHLSPGAWVLRWQVLATDGHLTRGEISFHVR